MSIVNRFFILVYFINEILAITNVTVCQSHGGLMGSNEDLAKIVEATTKAAVTLQCRYCGTSIKFDKKVTWYYKRRGHNDSFKKINALDCGKIDMFYDALQLKNFDIDDNGIYSCYSAESEIDENNSYFTYVVEAVFNNLRKPVSGTYEQWIEYHKKYIDPINYQFERSDSPLFLYLRKILFVSFQIKTIWGDWGPCVQQDGKLRRLRRKLGNCVLHTFPCGRKQENDIALMQVSKSGRVLSNYFTNDHFDISCHSIKLESLLPELSKMVRIIPNYEMIEECSDTENVKKDVCKRAKFSNYKYNTTNRVVENSHLTLVCPETSLDSDVKWYKNGCYLNSSFRNNMAQDEKEPHLTIDSSHTLYILYATKKEEGIYACEVDKKGIQIFKVHVVTKSTLLNEEFIRYCIYLGVVLSLTMTCYCAGMCIAWHHRNSFVDPHNGSFKRNQDPAHQE